MMSLGVFWGYSCIKLKVDTPTDYRHTDRLWTGNGSSLLFAAHGKADPLISTTAHQKFDLDP